MTTKRKSVLITGASHGIGLSIARTFHEADYDVLALSIDGESLRSECAGFATVCIELDVRAPVAEIREACGEHWPPQVLVNNVGIMDGRSFLDLPPDRYEDTLQVNLVAPYRLTQRWALDLIAKTVPGSCVFVSSLHSKRVRRCPDYSTSKAAASMLVRELAAELGRHRIRVNEVSPGAIDTWSDSHPSPDEHRRSSEALIPMRKIGEPTDVAKAVLFLADEDASGYVTGADLKIDGGLDTYTWLDHLYSSADDEASRNPL